MNLFEQQRSNRRRTWAIMLVFVSFLVLLGAGFDLFVLGQQGVPIPIGALAALGVGGAGAWSGYLHGDRAVLLSANAVPVDKAAATDWPDAPLKLQQFNNIVEEMAIASGLPKPAAYIIPDTDPNAFATGRDPQHASIAVTRGLLDLLNREQLQGVVGHEMSHIRNYDIRLMTVVAALVGAIALIADWSARAMRHGFRAGGGRRGGKDKGGGAALLVVLAIWLVAMIVAPFVTRLLALAVSRRREYLADASAAELTRNPSALAAALQTIEFAAEPTRSIKQGSAHLCIADPLGRAVTLKEGFWADLLATHPPMVKRIALLKGMAYEKRGSDPILTNSVSRA
ncbi:MAG TPA: M48 family metallopeptidase [Vicinamibacterales bacterium]|nr:M48 family metallopeptidase [Vicinamibacterales bacterium]